MMVWIVAILALAVLAVFVSFIYVSLAFRGEKCKKYLGLYRSPAVALEMVESIEDVYEIVGGVDDKRRYKARTSVCRDPWLISSYLFLFITMSAVPWRLELPWTPFLAAAVVLVGVAAAVFDLFENHSIMALLSEEPPSRSSIDAVRHRAVGKWAAYFSTVALISVAFVVREGAVGDFGIVVLAASMGCLITLLRAARSLLEKAIGLASLGLLAMAVLFFWQGLGEIIGH